MQSVLLSNALVKPDAQGMAMALAASGRLGAFMTGVAADRASVIGLGLSQISRISPRLANRLLSGVRPSRIHSLAGVELGARGFAAIARCARLPSPTVGDYLYVAHDAAVSAVRWPSHIDGVYAYEDGALLTFRRARAKNMGRVWDLPTPHYATVERTWLDECARWPDTLASHPPVEPRWKKRRKDAELALATHVCVASRFTATSLEAIGLRTPISILPYGFPVDAFRSKESPPAGPFTVLAVGSHNWRKGTPYLLEAWRRADLKDARLRLIGPMTLPPKLLMRYQGAFEHVPHLPRARLEAEYQNADVLVFPTLADGFGLVIQESMCCGTPVITTRCGGGPECIDHGREGWLIPERNLDALVESLRLVAIDRQATFVVGQAARARAERFTWKDAGAALANLVATL
jgi:glycosyltransferase involved in cell wall biosynthesis